MAIFFLLVGLEIKRELLVGELASVRRAILPLAAAVGGMAVPAAIYIIFNAGTPTARGWGIPMATDIAFALGVLSLAGSRVPPGLRIFLAALAIIDDLGAVLVIAFFYTAHISWVALALGFAAFILLLVFGRLRVQRVIPYLVVGIVLWIAFLLSGVHATIAGVLFALAVPSNARHTAHEGPSPPRSDGPGPSLAERFEHALNDWVAFAIVPVFALANAGVVLAGGVGPAGTWQVFLGVAAGLLLGKPIGITLASWIAIASGASAPTGVGWRHIVGAGLLGGIGFTMAIFIANLAFTSADLLSAAKIGILVSSPIAALAGLLVLWTSREPR